VIDKTNDKMAREKLFRKVYGLNEDRNAYKSNEWYCRIKGFHKIFN